MRTRNSQRRHPCTLAWRETAWRHLALFVAVGALGWAVAPEAATAQGKAGDSTSSLDALRAAFPESSSSSAKKEKTPGITPPQPMVRPGLIRRSRRILPQNNPVVAPSMMGTSLSGTMRKGAPKRVTRASPSKPSPPTAPLAPTAGATPVETGRPMPEKSFRGTGASLSTRGFTVSPPRAGSHEQFPKPKSVGGRGSKSAARAALNKAIKALPNISSARATPANGGAWPSLGARGPTSDDTATLDAGTSPTELTGEAAMATPMEGEVETGRSLPMLNPGRVPEKPDDSRSKGRSTKTFVPSKKSTDSDFASWDKELNAAVRQVNFVSEDGLKFEGVERKNKKFKGIITYPDGGRYDGFANGGKREGKGKMIYHTGGVYEGEWRNDKRHGKGVTQVPNGNRFEGTYRDGKKHGKGVYVWEDGGRYEGGFLEDRLHGEGHRKWGNGDSYKGGWKHGQRDGSGHMVYHDGDRYEGGWRKDKQHGQGIYRWRTGALYDGDWQDGKRHGKGAFGFADGRRYEGNWRYDYRDGKGVMIARDGARQDGYWRMGKTRRTSTASKGDKKKK